jgi:hypothetical protein
MPQTSGATTLAMAFVACLAVFPLVVVAAFNAFLARRSGGSPLTHLVEHYLRRYPLFAAALAGGLGALVGHVFWSTGDNPAYPPEPAGLLLVAFYVTLISGLVGVVLLWLVSHALVLAAKLAFRLRQVAGGLASTGK